MIVNNKGESMLFVPIKFKTSVYLSAAELDARFQDRIFDKLKESYEGVCSKFGFIKPNSLEILKKTQGKFIKEYFNGHIKFDLHCFGETCNPVKGTVVNAVVKNKNQLGILAESSMSDGTPILDIIIPIKSAGIISQIDLDNVQLGDTISVEVMGKKYQIQDKKISIIGRAIASDNEEPIPLPEEEEEVEPELEEEVYVEEEEEEEKKIIEKTGGELEEEAVSDEEFEEDFDEDLYDEEEDLSGGEEEYINDD